ncbi:hypothetical protein [Sphingomonas sp. IW22]|uniref:hypothetical protein n=1 Tax=Sphingomonas sp. IW22 TaxID=3242489 RepID=UPI0035202C0A
MKLIALTAALAMSGAAYAQNMSPQTAPAGSTMGQTPPATATPAPTAQPMQGDMSTQQQPMNGQPMTGTGATETKGGYMPSTPPMSGMAQPGATVRVQPSMSPSQAFPPPAPKGEYPICKKGQTDGCRQRGG